MDARNSLGYIYEQLNNYDAAAQVYEDTLKVEPHNLYALNHLGLAYKQLGRLDDAERVLRQAVEMDPKSARPDSKNLRNYLALIYLEKGDIGEAIAEFRESIRLFPKDIWSRQNLASLYEAHGRYYEAQLQYHKILEIDPQNLLAPTRLQALEQLDRSARMVVDLVPVNLIDIDIEGVIAAAPDAADYPDADAIILLNQFSHEVTASGKSRYTTHQVVKILTERGRRTMMTLLSRTLPRHSISLSTSHGLSPPMVLLLSHRRRRSTMLHRRGCSPTTSIPIRCGGSSQCPPSNRGCVLSIKLRLKMQERIRLGAPRGFGVATVFNPQIRSCNPPMPCVYPKRRTSSGRRSTANSIPRYYTKGKPVHISGPTARHPHSRRSTICRRPTILCRA